MYTFEWHCHEYKFILFQLVYNLHGCYSYLMIYETFLLMNLAIILAMITSIYLITNKKHFTFIANHKIGWVDKKTKSNKTTKQKRYKTNKNKCFSQKIKELGFYCSNVKSMKTGGRNYSNSLCGMACCLYIIFSKPEVSKVPLTRSFYDSYLCGSRVCTRPPVGCLKGNTALGLKFLEAPVLTIHQ